MTVTILLDDELRQKDYWAKVTDTQLFEYLKDREGGIAMLKDQRGRLVSCAKWRVVFPENGIVAQEAMTIDNNAMKDDNSLRSTDADA